MPFRVTVIVWLAANVVTFGCAGWGIVDGVRDVRALRSAAGVNGRLVYARGYVRAQAWCLAAAAMFTAAGLIGARVPQGPLVPGYEWAQTATRVLLIVPAVLIAAASVDAQLVRRSLTSTSEGPKG